MQEQLTPDATSCASLESDELSSVPMLSIGMPVYNGDKWIKQTIDSILGQSMGDFELIISDNASTDNTEAICRSIADSDSRVRYIRNPTNIGLYSNFNRVFELAAGKYFKWAADSDYCLEGFFEKCVDVLETQPDVVLVYTKAFFLTKEWNGKEVTVEYFDDFNLMDERPSVRFRKYLNRERFNNIMHGIIRTSALSQTRLHLPWAGSDISMVAELSLRGKFVEVTDRLFVRRFDPQTSSSLMNRSTAAKRDVPLGRTIKQRLMLHIYRYITVNSAPISFSEKTSVWLYLLRDHIKMPYWLTRRVVRGVFSTLFRLRRRI